MQNSTFILAIHTKFPKQAELDDGYRDANIVGKVTSRSTEKHLSQNQGNGDLWKEREDHDCGEHTDAPCGASNDIVGTTVYILLLLGYIYTFRKGNRVGFSMRAGM